MSCPTPSGDDGIGSLPVLLLWGRIDAHGRPALDPAFFIVGPASPPRTPGDYRIAGRSEDDATLFSLTFAMPEAIDGDGSSGFVFLLPAQVEWVGRLASVTLSGPGGSVTMNRSSHRPMAIVRDRESRQIRAILRDLPSTIGTRQAAQAWADPPANQDVFFSRGIPDAQAWCDASAADQG